MANTPVHPYDSSSEVAPNRTPAGNKANATTPINNSALGTNLNGISKSPHGGLQLHPTYHKQGDQPSMANWKPAQGGFGYPQPKAK